MSDFLRIPVNPALAGCGVTTLARLTHHAEDTDNDILSLQVLDELVRRGSDLELSIFRDEYIRLHREPVAERSRLLKERASAVLALVEDCL